MPALRMEVNVTAIMQSMRSGVDDQRVIVPQNVKQTVYKHAEEDGETRSSKCNEEVVYA